MLRTKANTDYKPMPKHEETPLGHSRQWRRLREELLAYRDAKQLVVELVMDVEHRKRAIALLYSKTGGNKWLTPHTVRTIIADTQEPTCTT